MKKIIPIIILISAIGYLGYSNYQLNKEVKKLNTDIQDMKVVQGNVLSALNITANFLQQASGGQFSQYVSQFKQIK